MIRGKAIEEAIRFSYAFHRDQFSIPAAQNYANDLYYLRTKNLPSFVVKNNALPINTLVRTGIKAFTFLKVKTYVSYLLTPIDSGNKKICKTNL